MVLYCEIIPSTIQKRSFKKKAHKKVGNGYRLHHNGHTLCLCGGTVRVEVVPCEVEAVRGRIWGVNSMGRVVVMRNTQSTSVWAWNEERRGILWLDY